MVLPTILATTNMSMPSCAQISISTHHFPTTTETTIPAIFDAYMEVCVYRRGPFRLREYATCAGGSVRQLGDWSRSTRPTPRPVRRLQSAQLLFGSRNMDSRNTNRDTALGRQVTERAHLEDSRALAERREGPRSCGRGRD